MKHNMMYCERPRLGTSRTTRGRTWVIRVVGVSEIHNVYERHVSRPRSDAGIAERCIVEEAEPGMGRIEQLPR